MANNNHNREPSLRAMTQQQRAKWAWDAVAEVSANDEVYLREARKLPARLLTSGMGQTMAYLHAKSHDEEGKSSNNGIGLLYNQLGERLRTLPLVQRRLKPAPKSTAMELIVRLEPSDYRTLSRELLASAEWIKRFAEGKGGS